MTFNSEEENTNAQNNKANENNHMESDRDTASIEDSTNTIIHLIMHILSDMNVENNAEDELTHGAISIPNYEL